MKKNYQPIINNFAKHLLTTPKKFLYVGINGRIKPIKRNKALSKFFREDISDFVCVTETENNIFFSDACSSFANQHMTY